MDSTSLSFDLSFGDLQDPDDLRTLAALGFRTLVDVRDASMPDEAENLGLRRIGLPITGDCPDAQTLTSFSAVMADSEARPVFVRGSGHTPGVLAVVWDAIFRTLAVSDAEALARGLGVGPLPECAREFIHARSAVYHRSNFPVRDEPPVALHPELPRS